MYVAEFGQGVADRIVDRALADLAAFYMGDRNTQRQRDAGRRQHFVSIGDDQHQVRPVAGQYFGQPQRRQPYRFAHPDIAVGTEQALDRFIDGKTLAVDFVDGRAKFGCQVGAHDDQFRLDPRMGQHMPQRPVQVAKIRSRRCDDCDFHWPTLVRLVARVRQVFHGYRKASLRFIVLPRKPAPG